MTVKRLFLLLLVLCGCPRKEPPPPGPPLTLPRDTDEAPDPGGAIGPGEWSEPRGLHMEIPDGWAGRNGPPGSSLLLSIRHDVSGVQVELWAFAWSGELAPRPRPGCEWTFVDSASHRAVPALTPAVTATCMPEDPLDPVVQGWFGRIRDREVHVEVLYPLGRAVEGRQLVEPLLASLSSR